MRNCSILNPFFLLLGINFALVTRDYDNDHYYFNYNLTNNFDYTIKVLRHGTPFADYKNFLVVELYGIRLPYQGIDASNDHTPEGSFLILNPGESRSMIFDLEDSFDLTLIGTYTMWLEKSIEKDEEGFEEIHDGDFITVSLSGAVSMAHQKKKNIFSRFLAKDCQSNTKAGSFLEQ